MSRQVARELINNQYMQIPEINCTRCGEKQWSVADQKYVELFDLCWNCDRRRWHEGIITLHTFETREKQASDGALMFESRRENT